jgi:hypothetical protein
LLTLNLLYGFWGRIDYLWEQICELNCTPGKGYNLLG